MPTPDTETLAARLRAVERALTDGEVLEPPVDPDERPEGRGTRDTGPLRTDGAGDDIERRLCRLEAAVQALRAAVDGDGTGGRPADDPAGPPEPVTASAATRAPPEHPSPAGDREGDWPDDLADRG